MARTEFDLASRLRPKNAAEFEDVSALRHYLIHTIRDYRRNTQIGMVADFSPKIFTTDSPFSKMGSGSLGGKGRGIAFINSILSRQNVSARWPNIRLRTPNTTSIATDLFDSFLERNNLTGYLRKALTDEEIRTTFLQAKLPPQLEQDLEAFLTTVKYPLAVRSSSLLEDSQIRPFAGIYDTYMLANNHNDMGTRLKQLTQAILQVYASTFSIQARNYLNASPHLHEDERMAVLIQELVGKSYGDKRFYPTFSGVAQSYNYYPIDPVKSEDGIAYVALGLGKGIVEGRRSLDFSPAYPQHLHQFSSVKDTLATSQRDFLALNLEKRDFLPHWDTNENIIQLPLKSAEKDGALTSLGSTYSPENDRIYDGIGRKGTRLVTFAEVLKGDAFPLADILQYFLKIGEDAIGCPVEIEFACNLNPSEFSLLQIRPMISWSSAESLRLTPEQRTDVFCYSPKALGHGKILKIADLIIVKNPSFDSKFTQEIALDIGRLNRQLKREHRHFALIGPGRWGSSDNSLGIPVNWMQISEARLIVEINLKETPIEPSYGTHFFHNVIASGIGYFTINQDRNLGSLDEDTLKNYSALYEGDHVKHIRFKAPLDILIDGKRGEGALILPQV